MSRRWRIREQDDSAAMALSAATGLPPLLGRVLSARGHRSAGSAADFLETSLSRCHDPWGLDGMRSAVERTALAIRNRERIVIFGDYDVDGVTSSALLVKLFRLLGGNVEFYIPDRLKEGYGPNRDAFRQLRQAGASLVITVDCGINAVEEARAAREMGLDLIVTDHHLPGPTIPDALAVINPKVSPQYPYPMLAGVGVAYKFAQALLETVSEPRRDEFLDAMLELVALGTVCDVAPLDGENRALVAAGIQRLRQGRWMGLRSLSAVAGLKVGSIDSGSLGFVLGPRLNAGGRIHDAGLGVRLLLSKDRGECEALAAQLNAENQQRQSIEKEVVAQALVEAEMRMQAGDRILVLWNEGWHAGVVGLAASRVQEKCSRPTVVLAVDKGLARGSARSRRPFHLVKALERCSDLLERFGGHEFAAGMTLSSASLEAFRARMNEAASGLSEDDLIPEIDVDCEAKLQEMDRSMMDQLDRLQPFGQKNPKPVFVARSCRLLAGTRTVGSGGEHLKLVVRQGPVEFSGIAFRQAETLLGLDREKPVDLVFSPGWNEYQGTRTLQLEVKDMAQAV